MWVCFGFDGYMHLKQFNILNLICTKVTFKNYRKVLPKFYFGKRSSVHCSSDLVIFFIVFCSQALASIIRTGIRLDFYISIFLGGGGGGYHKTLFCHPIVVEMFSWIKPVIFIVSCKVEWFSNNVNILKTAVYSPNLSIQEYWVQNIVQVAYLYLNKLYGFKYSEMFVYLRMQKKN